MLNVRNALSLTVSSSAPMYSVVVTAPLIVGLVGMGAPLVYVLAAIPALLTCWSMALNDRDDPSKGTVFSWSRKNPWLAWAGGYALAVTGIVASSGLAFVAVDTALEMTAMPESGLRLSLTLAGSAAVILAAMTLNITSLQLTSLIQNLGILVQIVALAVLQWIVFHGGAVIEPAHGDFMDWVRAVLIAVFAYWGFDAVFSMTEESRRGVPRTASFVSIVVLVAYFSVSSGILSSPQSVSALGSPIISVAIIFSCVMALGTTLIPTVRGMEAMAGAGALPAPLASRKISGLVACGLACAWTFTTALAEGFFWDSIEALSVFVGIYFVIASLAAWRRTGHALHLVSVILMGLITALTAVQTFHPAYGLTAVGNVGTVGLIVVGISLIGVLGALKAVPRIRELSAQPHSVE